MLRILLLSSRTKPVDSRAPMKAARIMIAELDWPNRWM